MTFTAIAESPKTPEMMEKGSTILGSVVLTYCIIGFRNENHNQQNQVQIKRSREDGRVLNVSEMLVGDGEELYYGTLNKSEFSTDLC